MNAVSILTDTTARMVVKPMRRFGMWRWMALGICGVCWWDGLGYAVKGNSIAAGKTLAFLRNSNPWGMHTHGALMLILSAFILYSLKERGRAAYISMMAVFLYAIALSCGIIWGWVGASQITWSAPSKWFFVAWVAFGLAHDVNRPKARNHSEN